MQFKKVYTSQGRFSGLAHKVKDSDHLVHFYDDHTTLQNAVCNFIIPGLTANQGVVIIATKENIKTFEEFLKKRSIDIPRAILMRQLVILDAQETINKFMDGNKINPHKFEKVIGSVFVSMKNFIRIRAYGEMVNLLWHQNQKENAMVLEQLWNEMATRYRFSLLCGYQIPADENFLTVDFSDVCHKHTHIITKDGLLKTTK